MRLIDADKTRYSVWGFERYTGIDEAPMEYAEEIIDKQPTVEAIPIEWLEKWVKETYPITENWEDYMVSFGELIKAWEKENEI